MEDGSFPSFWGNLGLFSGALTHSLPSFQGGYLPKKNAKRQSPLPWRKIVENGGIFEGNHHPTRRLWQCSRTSSQVLATVTRACRRLLGRVVGVEETEACLRAI